MRDTIDKRGRRRRERRGKIKQLSTSFGAVSDTGRRKATHSSVTTTPLRTLNLFGFLHFFADKFTIHDSTLSKLFKKISKCLL